jgi:hypothetical protein
VAGLYAFVDQHRDDAILAQLLAESSHILAVPKVSGRHAERLRQASHLRSRHRP